MPYPRNQNSALQNNCDANSLYAAETVFLNTNKGLMKELKKGAQNYYMNCRT